MNEILIKNTEELINFKKTDNIHTDIIYIIESSQELAYKSVNLTLLVRNWLIGQRIYEEELNNSERKETYGLNIISNLSKKLSEKYGKGFNKTNLYSFYLFYKLYPNIFHSLSGKSNRSYLSWTHYRILLQGKNKKARDWYEEEAVNNPSFGFGGYCLLMNLH